VGEFENGRLALGEAVEIAHSWRGARARLLVQNLCREQVK
jgi:hypothetical protein